MHTKAVISLFLMLCLIGKGTTRKQKSLEITKYASCTEYPNLPVMFYLEKKKMQTMNRGNLEITVNVSKDLSENMHGSISLWKCDSSGSPDSCEYFVKDLKLKNLCEKMVMKDQSWTPFVEGFNPPLKCPIKANSYKVAYSFNEDIFRFLPVPTGVWKSKGFMYINAGEMAACVDVDTKVVERRV